MDINVEKDDETDIIAEELKTMIETYKEDLKIISRSPLEINVHIRAQSVHIQSEDYDMSALLSIRCVPGYPYKCPELQVMLGRSVPPEHAEYLLDFLYNRENHRLRSGRIRISVLVESVRSYLSVLVPMAPDTRSLAEKIINWNYYIMKLVPDSDETYPDSDGTYPYRMAYHSGGYTYHRPVVHVHASDILKIEHRLPRKVEVIIKGLIVQLEKTKEGSFREFLIRLGFLKDDHKTTTFAAGKSKAEESSGHGSVSEDQEAEAQECCICLSSYEEVKEVRILPCGHFFHTSCITRWLHIKSCCPLCKLEARI